LIKKKERSEIQAKISQPKSRICFKEKDEKKQDEKKQGRAEFFFKTSTQKGVNEVTYSISQIACCRANRGGCCLHFFFPHCIVIVLVGLF
jgi:uncharacterized membrane protein YhiD involved in acid resistance